MHARTIMLLSVLAACGGDPGAGSQLTRPSTSQRDAALEAEQQHAATFSVGDPVRIRASDPRAYLRGQTGKILGIERKSTLQHVLDERDADREILAPVSRFHIELDDRGVKCHARPWDVEHRSK